MALTTVNSDGVKDDSIKNIDVKSDAAIAGTKIAPDFGSQNIVTTGKLFVGTTALDSLDSSLQYNAGASGSFICLGRNDTTVSGNKIGGLRFFSNDTNIDSGNYLRVGEIACQADGDFLSGDAPTKMTFSTMTDGTTTLATRMTIDSSGNVGIGTTIPDNLLHLYESSTTQTADTESQLVIEKNSNSGITILSGYTSNGRILFGDSGDNDIGQIDYDHNNDSMSFVVKTATVLTLDDDQKVGINTDAPDADLQVITSGSSDEDGTLKIGGSTATLGLVFSYDQSGLTEAKITANPNYGSGGVLKICCDEDDNPNQLVLNYDGTVCIGNDGSLTDNSKADNLVIGTTSGDNGITIFSGTDKTGNIYFADTDTTGAGNREGTITYVHSDGTNANYMRFSTAGNKERLRITSDGYIKYSGNNTADETNKLGRFLMPSHDTNEEDVMYFQMENEATFNQLTIGGGSSSYNAATNIIFRTAAVDTVTGAERLQITTDKVMFSVDAKVDASDSHDLGANGARWRDLYLSGDVKLAEGQGISFYNYGTGTSIDSNLLNDYEEGTFTPDFGGSSGESGQSYSSRAGSYTKIGNLVSIRFNLTLSDKGSTTGIYIQIKSLPFTAGSSSFGSNLGLGLLYFAGLTDDWIYLGLQLGEGTNAAYIWGRDSAGTSRQYPNLSDFSDDFQCTCSFTYVAA